MNFSFGCHSVDFPISGIVEMRADGKMVHVNAPFVPAYDVSNYFSLGNFSLVMNPHKTSDVTASHADLENGPAAAVNSSDPLKTSIFSTFAEVFDASKKGLPSWPVVSFASEFAAGKEIK